MLWVMSMKKTDLEKMLAKRLASGQGNARGDAGAALGKREQAMAKKRELLEKRKKK
jgi:hypothetical protein